MFSKKKGTATKTADFHEAKAEVIVQVRKYGQKSRGSFVPYSWVRKCG